MAALMCHERLIYGRKMLPLCFSSVYLLWGQVLNSLPWLCFPINPRDRPLKVRGSTVLCKHRLYILWTHPGCHVSSVGHTISPTYITSSEHLCLDWGAHSSIFILTTKGGYCMSETSSFWRTSCLYITDITLQWINAFWIQGYATETETLPAEDVKLLTATLEVNQKVLKMTLMHWIFCWGL